MTLSDWTQVEPSSSVEPSTDLFGGDILGDELIDIYNAAVVGGGDDDTMNEIPSLLAPTPENLKKDQMDLDPVGHTSHDDGLGAFRPSTSFNDLTTLLTPPPPTESSSNLSSVTASIPPPMGPAETAAAAAAKKRSLDVGAATTPAPKRRNSNSHKKATTTTTASSSTLSSTTTAQSKSKNKPGLASTTTTTSSSSIGSLKATAPMTTTAATTTTTKLSSTKAKTSTTLSKGKLEKKNDTPNPLTLGKTTATAYPTKITQSKAGGVKPIAVHSKTTTTAAAATSSASAASRIQAVTKDANAKKIVSAQPVLSNPPTEADFKCVAQAAVSNLIMNAGNLSKADAATAVTSKDGAATKVDTSTEHVKALTGSNWVSVCAGGEANTATNANADKMNNRARRQNLTPDERARQNRDRNREHARNTRLRKKAYVEELKRTLTALVAQRDATELEKRHSVQREMEQREVRFRVIEEFLNLRGRNEMNFARWAAILEDNFLFTLPLTDFRSMVHTESNHATNGFEQVLTGVSEAMADSNLLSSFIESLSKTGLKEDVAFAYSCDRKNFFMDNCHAVLNWTASTHGLVKQGSSSELSIKGNLKAHFSPASNKLISVGLTYDTGIVVSQVNQILKDGEQHCTDEDAAAAQVAASEADAILDSLQMPHMPASVPTNVTVVPSGGAASITDSSDESNAETDDAARKLVKTL